jgi:hypothetical protein
MGSSYIQSTQALLSKKVLNVQTHARCQGYAYHNVPIEFSCIQICSSHRCPQLVIDQTNPCHYSDTMWELFLQSVIDDRVYVSEKSFLPQLHVLIFLESSQILHSCLSALSPCAIPPKSLQNAVCHTSAVTGLFMNLL